MRDVADPLNRLVTRWSGFENLEQLVRSPFALACHTAASKNHWEWFQRNYLCDCYDNLCILRGIRTDDGSFRQADRGPHNTTVKGTMLDRVLAVPRPDETVALTSWTLRAQAYRRAWLYYANRPQPTLPALADACAAVGEIN